LWKQSPATTSVGPAKKQLLKLQTLTASTITAVLAAVEEMKCGGVCVAQIVFGRVEKTISAPTSPAISRSSTPAPSELDDEEDRDEEDEEADSEEEREELSKRETVSSLRDYAPNPAQDMMPANSA